MQRAAKHRAELKLPPIAAVLPMKKKEKKIKGRGPTFWTALRSLSAVAEYAAEEEASLTEGKIHFSLPISTEVLHRVFLPLVRCSVVG